MAKEGLSSVALPRLATGVGGLSWEDVRPLIFNQLADMDVDIFVYETFVPGRKAAEPGR
jgi:O-acetyl-ADP-ribose deacetylase (regulator of RNase III)